MANGGIICVGDSYTIPAHSHNNELTGLQQIIQGSYHYYQVPNTNHYWTTTTTNTQDFTLNDLQATVDAIKRDFNRQLWYGKVDYGDHQVKKGKRDLKDFHGADISDFFVCA